MGVGAKMAEHMFKATEGTLGVDDPVAAVQQPQPGCEGMRLGKRQQAAVELEFHLMEGVTESGDELAPEDNTEHVDGRKKDRRAETHLE